MAPSRPGGAACAQSSQAVEEKRFQELVGRLEVEPEVHVSAHDQESRSRRLLRFLRANCHDVDKTIVNLKAFTTFWKDYGMDSISAVDEYDEAGPFFVCGEDTDGCPVLVARPCVHRSGGAAESREAVRRCICTLQRAIERMSPDMEQFSVLYDVAGLSTANIDRHFIREFAACAGNNYPGRVKRVYVVNMNLPARALWAAVSTFLDPVLKSQIVMCGEKFDDNVSLKEGIPQEHPYLQYLRQVVCKGKNLVPCSLPKASPYFQGWRTCVGRGGVASGLGLESQIGESCTNIRRATSPGESTQAETTCMTSGRCSPMTSASPSEAGDTEEPWLRGDCGEEDEGSTKVSL
mmetsp:Transcript_53829/g.128232  ORF Transcript_53829/g.128232 Transcript_53829/m.128232 type:complete len:349 (-) Transcript_53829:23-1069(-)